MPQSTLAFNPYMPFWEYVPDGEPHVFGDRLYVYGSHDRRDGDAYCLEDYVVWSAPVDDLSRWRREGRSFRRTDHYKALGPRESLAAPDVAQGRDGRFYLYYCMGMEEISVAVSDGPAGPFKALGPVMFGSSSSPSAGVAFDPAVLVDDTGTWLYYGFDLSKAGGPEMAERSYAYAVRLADDMVTTLGEPRRIAPGKANAEGTPFEGHAFFEASSIRRVGDRYYFVWSSELGHELCYATAAAPDGPFEFGGTIVSISDIGYRGNTRPAAYEANTHGGMVEVEGRWYIFYHRHTHERQFSRQACAERIEMAPDGSIPQVEVTSCGLNDGPLPTGMTYPAHIACGIRGPEGVVHLSSRTPRRPSDPYLFQEGGASDGAMVARNMQPGAELTFKYLAFTGAEDACSVTLRGTLEGSVDVYGVSPDGGVRKMGSIPVGRRTGESWTTCEGSIATSRGVLGVRLAVAGTGACDIKDIYIGERR